jgi:SAM-dependent methyltransferase
MERAARLYYLVPRKRSVQGAEEPRTGAGNPPDGSSLAPYVNKVVKFRFLGNDASFRLSHALFSSFDIDEGTRILLKSIARQVDLRAIRSCLDVGCGVGVIGICVRLAQPAARVLLQDRDSLAVAFATDNALVNGCRDLRVDCGLAFEHLGAETFDLVVSNLPAKAGHPVLRSFFHSTRSSLAPGGTACVVIVAPLAELALSWVREAGAELVHRESTTGYVVLHFRFDGPPAPAPESRDGLVPYIRTEQSFSHRGTSYWLRTAWSLPDFDTLSHSLELSFDLLSGVGVGGQMLVWNPGQGHIPSFLLARDSNSITCTSLAGRDALELAITERALHAGGHVVGEVRAAPTPAALASIMARESVDFFAAAPQTIPRVRWHAELRDAAVFLLKPGGRLFLVSTSTEIHRFLEESGGLRLVASRKRLGHRAALLQRS